MSITYFNIDDDDESMVTRAVRAITADKASVTIGPLVTLEINTDLSSYKIGDRIPRQDQRSEYRLHAAADFSVRKGIWQRLITP
ncbi:hypothetical protein [Paenibacillus andongensis]|uniref:hypothetical protein n=1 Tax=Paenibacillus andongensis TaxID=2975482 RepID=UPI0021BAF338|nr:hypothetical protein [Paenibacillus andongensis]